MDGTIMAEGKNLFLCACDLNNRLRKEMLLRVNLAVVDEVQFCPPTKGGGNWKAKLTYKCDDVSVKLVNPKFTYYFILSEADKFETCVMKHDEERAKALQENSNAQLFNPQFVMPTLRGAKYYAYSMYYCPSKKKQGA